MVKRANGEGSIYRRKVDGMYVGSITLEDGKRKYFYSKKRSEVKAKLDAALRDKERGVLVVAPQQTLGQYFSYWLENCVDGSVRPRSFERYEEIVRLHLVPALGKIKLQALKPQHIHALQARKREEGLEPATIALIRVVLHSALDDTVKLELIARNVCDAVSPPREEKTEVVPLDLDQIKQLLAAAEGHPLETLIILALATAMRRGELLALKWQDINWARGSLRVQRILNRLPTRMARERGTLYVEAEPKSKHGRRTIELADIALAGLKRHRARQDEMRRAAGDRWEEHDYVFCTAEGKHLSPGSSVLEPFQTLLRKAGLPKMRFHDLRHSSATLLLSEGVPPKVVQEILGHSSIVITMDVYGHLFKTIQREARDRLNQVFPQPADPENSGERHAGEEGEGAAESGEGGG